MSLEIKQLPKSEIEIIGEIPAEEFSKFWPKAVEELAKKFSIPGFRPGKVPEKVLLEKLGDGLVLEKAGEMALQDIYPKIIEEKKLEVIGPPHASITKISKNGPLGYKFQTAILPEIEVPENYLEIASKIAKKEEKVVVEEKEINDSLEYIRKVRAKKDGGELPVLNDEFAKSVGKFDTLEELKGTLGKNILLEKKFKYKEKKRLTILDAILEKCKLEIPDIMVEAEKHKMLHELKSNILSMGLKWEEYLTHVKKKEEEVLAGWTDDALRRVKYGLLLRQLGKILEIEIPQKDIEEKIKELGVKDSDNIDRQGVEDYAYGIIRNEKVFTILEK